ncbi:MAG TPA: hypothetical protein VMQ67_11465 [Candidatus Saccharimonadales bacterium]|nr:hypothetical protein [Candidatus Saccharimonadales bacterium]
MNTNQRGDDELNAVLREWVVDSALPPRFEEQVWRGIARVKDQAASDPGPIFSAWLESLFNRPGLVISYIAILLVAGAMTGFWQVKDKSAESQTQWRARYVQSVDPYQMPRN